MTAAPERQRTLDELDPPAWGEPEGDSHLVTTCHALRRKPLVDFSIEDLRIMIGQGIGLRWLLPLALEALEAEPLAEGDFYPGDLLAAVLRVEPGVWSNEPAWRARTAALLARLSEIPEPLRKAIATFRETAV